MKLITLVYELVGRIESQVEWWIPWNVGLYGPSWYWWISADWLVGKVHLIVCLLAGTWAAPIGYQQLVAKRSAVVMEMREENVVWGTFRSNNVSQLHRDRLDYTIGWMIMWHTMINKTHILDLNAQSPFDYSQSEYFSNPERNSSNSRNVTFDFYNELQLVMCVYIYIYIIYCLQYVYKQ